MAIFRVARKPQNACEISIVRIVPSICTATNASPSGLSGLGMQEMLARAGRACRKLKKS